MSDAPTSVLNAVLFADLGDSTRLYERLGDARAHAMVRGCLARLDEVVHDFDGRVVKHIGDEVGPARIVDQRHAAAVTYLRDDHVRHRLSRHEVQVRGNLDKPHTRAHEPSSK